MMRSLYEFAPLYGKSVLAATAIGMAIGAFLRREPFMDLVMALWGPPTEAEATVSTAIHTSFGHTVVTDCVSTADLNHNSGHPYGIAAEAIHAGPYDVIRVDQAACDSVTSFAADPDNHDVQTVHHLLAVTHEVSHIQGVTHEQEYVAQCQAVQRVEDLAVGLGATEQQAADVATVAADNYPLTGLPEYDNRDGCYDGGALDLDPTAKGNFPGSPEHAPDGPVFMGPIVDILLAVKASQPS